MTMPAPPKAISQGDTVVLAPSEAPLKAIMLPPTVAWVTETRWDISVAMLSQIADARDCRL